ncbi:hypothetical protein T484DRAFT_1965427 [Baffinella frigidus]|nr:hypothetical protein T484DRAFT_1965427 [Cryptophyta sp. CCMP2293]
MASSRKASSMAAGALGMPCAIRSERSGGRRMSSSSFSKNPRVFRSSRSSREMDFHPIEIFASSAPNGLPSPFFPRFAAGGGAALRTSALMSAGVMAGSFSRARRCSSASIVPASASVRSLCWSCLRNRFSSFRPSSVSARVSVDPSSTFRCIPSSRVCASKLLLCIAAFSLRSLCIIEFRFLISRSAFSFIRSNFVAPLPGASASQSSNIPARTAICVMLVPLLIRRSILFGAFLLRIGADPIPPRSRCTPRDAPPRAPLPTKKCEDVIVREGGAQEQEEPTCQLAGSGAPLP